MTARTAIAPLALVVCALGASAYAYLDRGAVSDADRAARSHDVFPSFRVDQVRRIEIDHASEHIVLEPSGEHREWQMTSPHQEPADMGTVGVLLRELELAKRIREVPADEVPATSTRASGRISVGSIEYAFALDGDAPKPDGAAYMHIDGEGTFVVDRTLKVQLLRTANAYRDRTLVPYGASDVKRIEVRTPSGTYAIERNGMAFRVETASGLRASREAVERLLGALADARVDAFMDDAGGTASGNDYPVVVVTPSDGKPAVRLRFGGPCPSRAGDVIAFREGTSRLGACVPKASEDKLSEAPGDLVDEKLIYAHADEVEEVRLESTGAGTTRIDLVRQGTGWREHAPDDRALEGDEGDSVDALVGDLVHARALDVRAMTPNETFVARGRATIVRTGAGTSELVELGGAGPEGSTYARRGEDGAILRISRDVARRLEPHPVVVHGRAIDGAHFDAADVAAIDDTCGPTAQRLERRDGRWTMQAPRGFAVDVKTAADLAEAFSRARADAWIAETDDGAFGFQPPTGCAVTVTLSQAAGSGRHGIRFGSEHAGGVYARSLDGPAVFVAPEALLEQASRPAIDRSKLQFDPETSAHVTLVRDGDRRTADVGSSAPAKSGDAGPDDTLATAVAGLFARDAVHAGASSRSEGFDRPTLRIDAVERGTERHITIGALTHLAPSDAYFARVAGVDATFAVPRSCVDRILDAW